MLFQNQVALLPNEQLVWRADGHAELVYTTTTDDQQQRAGNLFDQFQEELTHRTQDIKHIQGDLDKLLQKEPSDDKDAVECLALLKLIRKHKNRVLELELKLKSPVDVQFQRTIVTRTLLLKPGAIVQPSWRKTPICLAVENKQEENVDIVQIEDSVVRQLQHFSPQTPVVCYSEAGMWIFKNDTWSTVSLMHGLNHECTWVAGPEWSMVFAPGFGTYFQMTPGAKYEHLCNDQQPSTSDVHFFVVGNYCYVFGRSFGYGFHNWRFDTFSKRWTRLPDLRFKYETMQLHVLGPDVCILGTYEGKGQMERFDGKNWYAFDFLPLHGDFVSLVFRDQLYLAALKPQQGKFLVYVLINNTWKPEPLKRWPKSDIFTVVDDRVYELGQDEIESYLLSNGETDIRIPLPPGCVNVRKLEFVRSK